MIDNFLPAIGVTSGEVILEFSYLLAAILFVIGLKLMSHPKSSKKGNIWAASGMGLAMLTTLFLHRNPEGDSIPLVNAGVIVLVIIIGAIMGLLMARRVKMTAMPQLVSLFNATGGAASALVALMEYANPANASPIVTLLGLVIGAIAFSGSIIAYGKLDNRIGKIYSKFAVFLNMFILVAIAALMVYMLMVEPTFLPQSTLGYVLLLIALIYGITFVMPIGGADMPVVISLLNSLTGVAAAMAGFIYSNQAMILGGILVGSAGAILTVIMGKAMNRSLFNVFFGAFGGGEGIGVSEDGTIKEITINDAAVLLAYSQNVVIVPGYGLAVAQAQFVANDLVQLLEKKDVEVNFAIHPVAGRMPGHMNVLLAEADVPYTKLVEMDDINPKMPDTDVTIVVGANDVVNPAAANDSSSPIYGMPIINAHKSKNIIVMKRGMGKGYAGIENSLFFDDKTRMLFGNAKESLQKLVNEIKEL